MATSTTMNTSMIERQGRVLVPQDSNILAEFVDTILDETWAKSAFLINDIDLLKRTDDGKDDTDIRNRYWSSASRKFTDTRMGGNVGVNPKPQFTRYSDIRHPGTASKRERVSVSHTYGNYGMGRYYSEAIDDPAQTIFLRFGVPEFNSLTTFLSRAFDPDHVSLARTGRATSIFYKTAVAAGTITTAIALPGLTALVFAGRTLNWIFSRPTSKFYTIKPTPHTYWGAVNSLVNNFAVERGLLPKKVGDVLRGVGVGNSQVLGQPYKIDTDQMDYLTNLMPDFFRQSFTTDTGKPDGKKQWDGTMDIFAMATRAQRISFLAFKKQYDELNTGSNTNFEGLLKRNITGDGKTATAVNESDGDISFFTMVDRVINFSRLFESKDTNVRSESSPRIPNVNSTEEDPNADRKAKVEPSIISELATYFDAQFSQATEFVAFRVDHSGSVSESFSNSTVESDLSSKINNISSQAKSARFTFAEGNLVGGVAGVAVEKATGLIKDVVMGGLEGVTLGFSNIALGLAGSGYIDIPKHWQSSVASLPRTNYTMQLISPYGNVISQLQNIYIPLFMILAGTLPLSTGKSSHTSPFICQLFDRGRCQIALGMIESLSITRGTSNLGFNTKGNTLAIDVSFTVADMSSIMHMPLSSGSLLGPDMALDEDNILKQYLSVLSGQDMYSQIYEIPKAKLKLAKAWASLQKVTSPAWQASMIHDSAKNGAISDLTLGLSNVAVGALELAARNSQIPSGSGTSGGLGG